MNFQESINYLYSLGNEVTAMKLGLESTERLLTALGNPQKKILKIQIAGTNGKGSTCAFLDSICRSAGIETGLTTSPHLISITERIKINGDEISEEKFAEHATKIRQISEDLVAKGKLESVPTFFEQVTAVAISAFAEAKIKLAILETGLGGRFDSVTATKAEIVAITPIDFDHQKILGNTLTEIAAEKAAIIRPDTRVIVSPQLEKVEKVIYGVCREKGIEPAWANQKVKIIEDLGGGLLHLSFKTSETNYKATPILQGKHQWTNAGLAIRIAETLRDFNFKISKENIETGIETAEHKGRLQFYKNILFDGAHNAAGAKALAEYLDEFIKEPLTLIFAAMRDKDLTEIAAILFSRADNLILTKPDNSRSMETSELLKYLPESFNSEKLYQTETVEEALKLAREIQKDSLICVTGSLYLVGEAQKVLSKRVQ